MAIHGDRANRSHRSERTELRVMVTQRSAGAVAERFIFFTGTGQTNQWEITVVPEGRAAFEAGPATVVGLARSSINGQTTGPPHSCSSQAARSSAVRVHGWRGLFFWASSKASSFCFHSASWSGLGHAS